MQMTLQSQIDWILRWIGASIYYLVLIGLIIAFIVNEVQWHKERTSAPVPGNDVMNDE